jgi:hypothetical protein
MAWLPGRGWPPDGSPTHCPPSDHGQGSADGWHQIKTPDWSANQSGEWKQKDLAVGRYFLGREGEAIIAPPRLLRDGQIVIPVVARPQDDFTRPGFRARAGADPNIGGIQAYAVESRQGAGADLVFVAIAGTDDPTRAEHVGGSGGHGGARWCQTILPHYGTARHQRPAGARPGPLRPCLPQGRA